MTFLLQVPVLLFAVVFHEFAHGFSALRRGDPTARDAGRLTLNPLPHLDPVGSVLVPLLLIISQGFSPRFLIGWAKPVPVNPRNLRRGSDDLLAVSLAGPASNLLLAVVCSLGLGLLYRVGLGGSVEALGAMLQYGVVINCVLAAFNLIPIPPLDGATLLYRLLPTETAYRYASLRPYGLPLLVLVMMAGGGRLLLAPARWAAAVLFGVSAIVAG